MDAEKDDKFEKLVDELDRGQALLCEICPDLEKTAFNMSVQIFCYFIVL